MEEEPNDHPILRRMHLDCWYVVGRCPFPRAPQRFTQPFAMESPQNHIR